MPVFDGVVIGVALWVVIYIFYLVIKYNSPNKIDKIDNKPISYKPEDKINNNPIIYNVPKKDSDTKNRIQNKVGAEPEVKVEPYIPAPTYTKKGHRKEGSLNLSEKFSKLTSSESVIYLWAFKDKPELVKVGITSSHLGERRIHSVAKKHNTEAVILAMRATSKAKAAERLIKNTFRDMGLGAVCSMKVDGHTELAFLNKQQRDELVELINTL